MQMNPNLILQAGQTADVMGALERGNALAQQQNEQRRQNALAGFMRDNGAALMQGDTNALAQFAQYDPMAAFDMMNRQQDRAWQQEDRQYQRERDQRQDSRQDQEWQWKVEEYAATKSAAERAAEAQQIEDAVKMGLAVPDAASWDAMMAQTAPDLVGQFGNRQALAQRYMSVAEILKGQQGQGQFRPASQDEAGRYGSPAGQFGPDGRFYPINPPSGMVVETGPDGTRIVQGPGAGANKPLTEGQSKDAVYATRAEGALATLESAGPDALTDRASIVADKAPLGIGRGIQSDQYQVARNAGDEFLQAILRKDTGAAITAQEQDMYGKTYLPQPGDGDAILKQKAQARRRALEALKAGMPPAAILQQEQALDASGSDRVNSPAQRLRFNPATGDFE